MDIFICDDSELIRERLNEMLQQIPELNIIGQAGNVSDSIEFMKRTKPEIAIIDFRFPDGTGLAILEFLKNMLPTTVAIVLTNYPLEQYREKCLALGADYFLDKSSEFEKVAEICIKIKRKMRKLHIEKLQNV